ncbi:MAG TPA: hypothetical protein VF661_07175, partial [Actinomycetales bacterium]
HRLAGALVVALALLSAGHVVAHLQHLDHPLRPVFHLDLERTAPALFSAALLLAAAAVALRCRRAPVSLGRRGLALALTFGVMGIDEVVGVHEALELRTGVDWQVLYAPLLVLAALAWLAFALTAARRADLAAVAGWVVGAGAWGTAQTLEALQWQGDVQRPGYLLMMPVEEVLEMVGSGALLLTLVLVHRTWRAAGRQPAQAGPGRQPPSSTPPGTGAAGS